MKENLITQIHRPAKMLDDPTYVCSVSIPEYVQPKYIIVVMVCFKHTL